VKVLLFTSVPLAPPWDQADKNLAYTLTRSLSHIHFDILVARRGAIPSGCNLRALPFYADQLPVLAQKALVFCKLYLSERVGSHHEKAKVSHMIYRPYPISGPALKRLPIFRERPVVHTVPATNDGKPVNPSLFFAQRVIAISEFGKRRLLEAGVQHVEHIPPGIWFDDWSKLAGREGEYKTRLGLDGLKIVLFPGHFNPGMGADLLLEAIPIILKKVPETTFVFACRPRGSNDVKRENEVKQLLARRKFSHRVIIYHTVGNMESLIGASDLVALPLQTMQEKVDIPTTLIEFLAAAKPVVITDLEPMNEIIHTSDGALHEVGHATPVGDVTRFAEAIIDLLADNDARRRMGANGQQLAEEKYNMRHNAGRYEQIYTELMAA
jgi:glycosyltransferase involved in cell wall biosynthesis